jgi:hypothetical protein
MRWGACWIPNIHKLLTVRGDMRKPVLVFYLTSADDGRTEFFRKDQWFDFFLIQSGALSHCTACGELPVAGKLLLFPSNLEHKVAVYSSTARSVRSKSTESCPKIVRLPSAQEFGVPCFTYTWSPACTRPACRIASCTSA